MATFVKVESNLCRCCHEEGLFVNLELPSKCTGEEKTYGELLKFCFDIQIKPIDKSESDVTYTICSSCIENLSSAVQFKKQVISCEERFQLMLSQKEHLPVCDVQIPVKKEKSEDELSKRSHSPCETDEDNEFLAFFANPSKRKRSKSDSSDDTKQGNILLDLLSTQQNGETLRGSRKTVKTRKKVKKSKLTVAKKSGEKQIEVVSDGDEKKANGKDQKSKCKQILIEENYSIVEKGGERTYFCHCSKVFKTKNGFLDHFTFYHKDNRKCPICGVDIKRSLTRHLAEAHFVRQYFKKGQRQFLPVERSVCAECNKQFPSVAYMTRHQRIIHKLYKCPECSDQFHRSDLLDHRMREHGLERPTCGICGYTTHTQTKINIHQRKVHMKEKNATCDVCSMQFFDNEALKKHRIVHSPDRKHECSYCHKRFPRKSTLRMHEKIHKGEKTKVCQTCGDRFVQKASLNYHNMKYHPESVGQ